MTDDNLLKMTCHVYVLLGKGGAGKSLLAVLIASLARSKSVHLDLFEGDPGNPTLSRYFDLPPERRLTEIKPDRVEEWLERGPFSPDRKAPALLDLGANGEGTLFTLLNGRGAHEVENCRFIVPIVSIEAVSTASRIRNNVPTANMLLVFNDFGDGLYAARNDSRALAMLKAGMPSADLPDFGRSAAEMSAKRLAPDHMAKDLSDRFAAQARSPCSAGRRRCSSPTRSFGHGDPVLRRDPQERADPSCRSHRAPLRHGRTCR